MKCEPIPASAGTVLVEDAESFLRELEGWEILENRYLVSTRKFKGYSQTTTYAFDVARLADLEDHHPAITFEYDRCTISLNTHSVDGLSKNDFILAAKIDKIFGEYSLN